ncbi:MAG: class I SAM-dependent methyltransferase [bacterium]
MGAVYPCPLCGGTAGFFVALPARPVYACPQCELRFVPEPWHVSPQQERARYELHRNSLEDGGYVCFLQPAIDALARHLRRGGEGEGPRSPGTILDYGSGPTPVLVELLNRAGFQAVAYDPFFAPDADLSHRFAAVISTETFEHFRRPRLELDRLVGLLNPGGLLVVLTALWTPERDFRKWPYANDETHIAFYSGATFDFMAATRGLYVVETNGKDLVVAVRR